MIVDKTKVTAEVFPPGENIAIGIRRLTGPEMDEAEDARQAKILSRYAGVDMGSVQQTLTPAEKDEAASKARYLKYDRDVLCRHAIIAWGYDVPVTPENIANLDAGTRDLVARAVVDQEVPPEVLGGSGASS